MWFKKYVLLVWLTFKAEDVQVIWQIFENKKCLGSDIDFWEQSMSANLLILGNETDFWKLRISRNFEKKECLGNEIDFWKQSASR